MFCFKSKYIILISELVGLIRGVELLIEEYYEIPIEKVNRENTPAIKSTKNGHSMNRYIHSAVLPWNEFSSPLYRYPKQSSQNFYTSFFTDKRPLLTQMRFWHHWTMISPHQHSTLAWHHCKSDRFSCFCPPPNERMLSVHSKLLCQALYLRPSL